MGCCQHSHKLPAMPLTCNVWHNGNTNPASPDISGLKCQLYVTAHLAVLAGALTSHPASCQFLYLPKGTDVRGADTEPGPDIVQCPAGTNRWYQVTWVDDVAKGFANEFRVALIFKVFPPWTGGSPWLTHPMP